MFILYNKLLFFFFYFFVDINTNGTCTILLCSNSYEFSYNIMNAGTIKHILYIVHREGTLQVYKMVFKHLSIVLDSLVPSLVPMYIFMEQPFKGIEMINRNSEIVSLLSFSFLIICKLNIIFMFYCIPDKYWFSIKYDFDECYCYCYFCLFYNQWVNNTVFIFLCLLQTSLLWFFNVILSNLQLCCICLPFSSETM